MDDNWKTIHGHRVNLKNGIYDLNSAIEEYYSKGSFPTYILPAKEYAIVQSEINTWYHYRFVGKKSCTVEIGDYIYAFKNHGFDKCRVVGKFSIENARDEFLELKMNKRGKRK